MYCMGYKHSKNAYVHTRDFMGVIPAKAFVHNFPNFTATLFISLTCPSHQPEECERVHCVCVCGLLGVGEMADEGDYGDGGDG